MPPSTMQAEMASTVGDGNDRLRNCKLHLLYLNPSIAFRFSGEMAEQIVKDIQQAGGFITLTDLSGYRAIERGPLRTKVHGLEMLSTPPPGSGALISLALKIMDGKKSF